MHTAIARMGDRPHQEVFEALTEMTRAFAQLADTSSGEDEVMAKLDYCLAQGWVLKIQFSIGSAGPLGCGLVAVSPQGLMTEIISIDAPPSGKPFRLDERKQALEKGRP